METTNAGQSNGLSVHVDAQGHIFQLKIRGFAARPNVGGPRGIVSEFSFASRKRMLELLARIDVDGAGFIAFVTLTYPDREGPPTASETNRDRTTFQKRIERFHPEVSAIWRREWEERKSGEFEGAVYPHYHYLFFGLPFLEADRLNAMWAKVLGWSGYVRTEIQGIRSWRQAFSYVAKYMAKPTEGGLSEPPKGPGAAGHAAAPPAGGEAARSLVYGAYLTGSENEEGGDSEELAEEEPRQSIGRSWGVFGRKRLPMAPKQEAKFKVGWQLEELRRLAKIQWEGVSDDPSYGFSLFVESADDWYDCVQALLEIAETGKLPEDASVLNPLRGAA